MLSRQIAPTVTRLARQFPVVAITGPRQSGKTTLARMLFPDKPYVSMEDPVERAFAEDDPRGFLARFTAGADAEKGAIFDEAQRWPGLFSHLQGIVDAERAPGRFVLTGSQQFGLLAGISQSLAGRVGMLQLLPLALNELSPAARAMATPDPLMQRGSYPALHAQALETQDWYASYVATYVERDVRQLARVQDLSVFQRFLRLCAGRTGQLLNLNALGEETGVTHATARAWLSLLETSYLVALLPPYHRNFGKRLVKTPKLYFLDTGLSAWLLGIRSAEQLSLHPMRGALFENLVVSEFIKARYNAGQSAGLYFWRDNNGLESDLVFEHGALLQTVEIKSGATVTPELIRAGQRSTRFAPDQTCEPWLIYGGTDSYARSGVKVIAWRELGNTLDATAGFGAVLPAPTFPP